MTGKADFAYVCVTALAIFIPAIVQFRDPKKLKLARPDRIALTLGAFCGGMLGAKLPFLFTDLNGLLSGAAWLDNGKTVLTGLAGGYFGVEYVKWIRGIRTKTGDSFVIPLALALGIGRLGCFLGGCCFGRETRLPWGVDFGDHIARHPTQLYEAFFHFSAAVFFVLCRQNSWLLGRTLKSYFLAYFVFRFFTEWLRPERIVAFSLTPYQLTSLALFLLFGALLWWDMRHLPATSRKGVRPPHFPSSPWQAP